MSNAVNLILPSLESLGIWSYWVIGLASMLEAFFVTGVFLPGTLVVDAGGILVQQGVLDFFDLVWFVAIGSVIGGLAGFQVGLTARRGLRSRWSPETSPAYARAEGLFRKYGGAALVLGRFLGPVSGLVPFVAAMSGMERRRFHVWNTVSGFPYALAHVALGYGLGDMISRLGPLATRLGLFLVAVLAILALIWWGVSRIARTLPFVLSVAASAGRGMLQNPDIQRWISRHGRTSAFLARRFDRSHFFGLTATLLGAAAAYVLFIWAGSVLDFLMADPIVQADIRLANLTHAFWSPEMLRLAALVTSLGDWKVVLPLSVAAFAWLWSRRRPDLAAGMVIALAGDLVSVMALKLVFHRPRPEMGYFLEVSGSFPSGHAAISVAFYGFLLFVVWRLKILRPVPAAMVAATVAFLIGFSRIYLIEHYLSDVLNGWLVGGLWLIVGVALAEWWRQTRPPAKAPGPQAVRFLAPVLCAGLVMVAGWQAVAYDKPRRQPVAMTRQQVVADTGALLQSGTVPVETESIVGAPLEPINVVVLARDEAALVAAMEMAGWGRAQDPAVGSLVRAAWSAWTNREDDSAPVTPYFWRGEPNALAFQKPTAERTLRKRHHVRFWRTGFATPEGDKVFVGAASFDNGLDWGLLHHIAPDIDAERDTLVADLRRSGVAADSVFVKASRPRLGQSVAGDPWFTDGRAVIVRLR